VSRHDPVRFSAPTAEERTVKTRKGSHDDVPSDDIEGWLHDLTDGETSARRLRARLGDGGSTTSGTCSVCTSDHSFFGPGGHLHGRRSA
jgi:hypothetical protein